MAPRRKSYVSASKPGLSASTTVPIGIAVAAIGVTIAGAWWAATVSLKVDALTQVGSEVKSDVNNVKNDVNSMKFDLNSVKTSVNQLSNETVRRK